MDQKTRIAFVGCGGMAEQHSEALAARTDVSLVGFTDISLPRAQQMAQRRGTNAKAFNDAKTMFDAVELDGAYFCLPPSAHGAELEAVEHNVPFFVEKPVNLYLDQASRIALGAEEKRLLTSVGYMNRYRAGVQKAKRLLTDDPVILALGGWIGGVPKLSDEVGIWTWWVQKDKSGGQFHEQVTHTVDLLRYFCGEVLQVHAFAARGLNKGTPPLYSTEDASVVNLRFESGAIANLWAGACANAGGGIALDLYANDVTARFSGWEFSAELFRTGEEEPEHIPGEEAIFAVEDDAFVQAIRKNDPSLVKSSYADGVKTAAVTLAANRSMDTGKPVTVD
jgi:predicted dehydrogenase